MDDYVTVMQASKLLGVCDRQIRNYCSNRIVNVRGKNYKYMPLFKDVLVSTSNKNVKMYLINKKEILKLLGD